MLKQAIAINGFIVVACNFAAAQVPNTCTSQQSCLESATAKYGDSLETGVYTKYGKQNVLIDSKYLGYWVLTGNPSLFWSGVPTKVNQSFPPPQDNISSSLFTPSPAAWAIPAGSGGLITPTPNFPALDITKGFTVMINAYIDPNDTSGGFEPYYVLFYQPPSGNANPTYISLGRDGLHWGVSGTTAVAPASYKQNYTEFPWDAIGTGGVFQDVFYTFSPDGKLEIDIFNGQDWESSLIDFGANLNGAPAAGTPTSNPTSYPFAPINNSTVGFVTYANPSVSGFNYISVFPTPLSSKETAAWAYQADGGTWHNFPCNTGYELNFDPPKGQPPVESVDNACGYTSNWLRTTPNVVESSVSPASATFGSSGETVPITLTNTGTAPLQISSVSLGGSDPGDFAENNDCPSSLGVNASCNISVTAQFIKSGDSAALMITTNGTNSPETVALNEEEK